MAELQTDDVMPNDGTFFGLQEPEQQIIDRKKEKARTLEALPILRDVLARLDDRITFYGSVDSIPGEVKAAPDQFLIMHNANEMVRNNLRAEKEWIESLIEEHTGKK